MSNIKIFVSHRIDLDSETIDNPMYVNIRCGAVYDKRNGIAMQGDDTGDNISEKRESFCEFTVQYWAWKNIQADYYGLCHYRRYLSFSQQHFKTNHYNMIFETAIVPTSKKRHGLLNEGAMAGTISDYDIVISEYAKVRRIITPCGTQGTVYEMWSAYVDTYFEQSAFDLVLPLIDEMAPGYSKSAREYFNGSLHRGFNCFIIRRKLFERMCEFQFPIMFEVARRLNTTGYTQTMLRTPAFIGEMLYGIFFYHVTHYEEWKLKEAQLVFFDSTKKITGRIDLLIRYISIGLNRGLRAIIDPIMPIGSKRREKSKDIFYSIVTKHNKRKDIA